MSTGSQSRRSSQSRSRSRWAALALVALVVLAGCSVPPGESGDDRPAQPDDDRLGWEGGYWYDDPVNVTPGDGYNESERAALVNRTMARVERIRGLEFNHSVPVEVISREQYRRNRSGGGDPTHEAWNDQVWESLFLVPEDRGVSDSFNQTLGTSVQGYYSPGEDSIVLVSDSETPTVDRATLAHELVHALQDQHFGFGPYPDTQDRQLAADSVIEGEANAIEARYTNRCEDDWSCIPPPERSGSGSNGEFNRGVFLTIFTPYTAGQRFVERVRADGGWDAVDDLHEAEPNSTEQVIHEGDYPDEAPVNVTVPDRSTDEWQRFDHDPVADVVGEASIYAMFLDNGVVSVEDRYGYRSDPSAGWGGDAVVPYRSDEAAAGEGAYVWRSVWDTERDARQFVDAYRDLLDARNATTPRESVYVVPEGDPYGDAFRVVRDGKRVTVVNAPTVADLEDVHGPTDGSAAGPANGTTSSDDGPGLGAAAALVALLAASALLAATAGRRSGG